MYQLTVHGFVNRKPEVGGDSTMPITADLTLVYQFNSEEVAEDFKPSILHLYNQIGIPADRVKFSDQNK